MQRIFGNHISGHRQEVQGPDHTSLGHYPRRDPSHAGGEHVPGFYPGRGGAKYVAIGLDNGIWIRGSLYLQDRWIIGRQMSMIVMMTMAP